MDSLSREIIEVIVMAEKNQAKSGEAKAGAKAAQKNVQIYSTPTCHWCMLTKEYFRQNNVKFTDHNVAMDAKARDEMVQKTGQLGVPVIDIDGQIVIGFDKPRLGRLLGIKG
jgi:glutaredoxin 3